MKIILQMVRLVAGGTDSIVAWSRLSLLFLSPGYRSKKGMRGLREWWELAGHLPLVVVAGPDS